MAINAKKLKRDVYEHICKNMGINPDSPDSITAVSALDAEEAFNRWCWWNGFLGGWAYSISASLDSIRSAERSAKWNDKHAKERP